MRFRDLKLVLYSKLSSHRSSSDLEILLDFRSECFAQTIKKDCKNVKSAL